MDDSFFTYLQQLELIVFFSGYPLLYAIISVITGRKAQTSGLTPKPVSLLPYAYALVGVLYIGFVAKNLYPDYSIEHIKQIIQQPYLKAWAFLSVLFFIPLLAARPVISLLHSLVFFFFILKDLFFQSAAASKDRIRNDMKLYTGSLLLNLCALLFIALIYFLITRFRYNKKKNTPK